MRPTKEQIDKAEKAYEANRKLISRDCDEADLIMEHTLAIMVALKTVGNPSNSQIIESAKAYQINRNIRRWDGFTPCGMAGRRNHRNGIRRALYCFKTQTKGTNKP